MTQEEIREAGDVPGRKSSTLDGPDAPQPLDALKAWLGTAPPSPHDTEIRKLVRAAMGQVEELVTRSLAALHAETVERQQFAAQCAFAESNNEELDAKLEAERRANAALREACERLVKVLPEATCTETLERAAAALATDAGKDFVPRERLNEVARNAAHATREACVDALPDLRLDGAEACVRAVDVETIATEAAGAPSVLADVLRERAATHHAVLAHVHQQHAEEVKALTKERDALLAAYPEYADPAAKQQVASLRAELAVARQEIDRLTALKEHDVEVRS